MFLCHDEIFDILAGYLLLKRNTETTDIRIKWYRQHTIFNTFLFMYPHTHVVSEYTYYIIYFVHQIYFLDCFYLLQSTLFFKPLYIVPENMCPKVKGDSLLHFKDKILTSNMCPHMYRYSVKKWFSRVMYLRVFGTTWNTKVSISTHNH